MCFPLRIPFVDGFSQGNLLARRERARFGRDFHRRSLETVARGGKRIGILPGGLWIGLCEFNHGFF
jgi:hypothetical protein